MEVKNFLMAMIVTWSTSVEEETSVSWACTYTRTHKHVRHTHIHLCTYEAQNSYEMVASSDVKEV